MSGELPLKHFLKFEPFAGLDQNTLQCILSEKNVMKNEIISDGFISHIAKQTTSPEDSSMYITIDSISVIMLFVPKLPVPDKS